MAGPDRAEPETSVTSGDPLGDPQTRVEPPTEIVPAAPEATPAAPEAAPVTEAPASGDPLAAGPPADADATVVIPAAPAEEAPAPAPGGDTQTVVADGAVATDEAVVVEEPADQGPGFRDRARMRRRLRYLRRLRELLFRDVGGLAFDLHKFGRDRPDLVQEKLVALQGVDGELRTLEDALRDRRQLTELREAGISACPRCGTLHDTDANFCPACGTSLHGKIPAPPLGEPQILPQPAEGQ